MTFIETHGVPPDPAYVRFRDGLVKADNDVTDRWRWRWHPKTGKWYAYAVNDFVLDDIGIPDTAPGYGFELTMSGEDDDTEKARADLWLPAVFRNVQAAYRRYSVRWPNLVWTWRNGGDWRAAIQRARPDQYPDPVIGSTDTTGDDPLDGLNPECVKRVGEVREWVRRGVIPTVDGQKLIRQIVADCSVERP